MDYDYESPPRKKRAWFFQPETDWELLIVDVESEKDKAEDAPRFVLGEAALAGGAPVQVDVWLGSLLKTPRPKRGRGILASLFRRGYFSSDEG